ncbi:MAG: mechanosensitive ion channel family protein [Burkholderiales bacterium]|jgi:miniconductance mechanosensitive channel|nr:mechanosensitive ion channel family protein [Burkholderiales bacterium]
MENIISLLDQWGERYAFLNWVLPPLALALVAWLANRITKVVLLRLIHKVLIGTVLRHIEGRASPIKAIDRLSNVVPAMVVFLMIGMFKHFPPELITIIKNVCGAFMILTIALSLNHILDWCNKLYQHRADAAKKPIKGYLQVIKIAIYAIATVLIIANLMDRSPLILLSGLGAMAAVLMLIFQDTILSLVASVQLSSNDMVRVGDWIEMPNLNTDGAVIDIALHTVKVQNWDNTITTIPTKRLISDSFKNWRGMSESGGRRIKRSIFLDQHSVRFLSDEDIKHLERLKLIDAYLHSKENELNQWNEQLKNVDAVNHRRLTNIGTFRAYVVHYLKNHPNIHPKMTLLVRQLSPTAAGVPIEIYCFTNTTVWAEYEDIQSDIFDHLFAIVPEFGLRVFQNPSGADMRSMSEFVRSTHRQT